jgi:hypothetical protein
MATGVTPNAKNAPALAIKPTTARRSAFALRGRRFRLLKHLAMARAFPEKNLSRSTMRIVAHRPRNECSTAILQFAPVSARLLSSHAELTTQDPRRPVFAT